MKKRNYDKLCFPSPIAIRRHMLDLNGSWRFAFDDGDEGLSCKAYENTDFFNQVIQVPYAYQSKASGIDDKTDHPIVWYQKDFRLQPDYKTVLLHFGAVDYACDIWINGQHAGSHKGGHTPFSLDISRYVTFGSDNSITLRVEDRTSTMQPIGKQSWKDHNFLCWYTRTTGIWQSVWIEQTGEAWIDTVETTAYIDDASVHFDIMAKGDLKDAYVQGEIFFEGKLVNTFSSTFKNGRARIGVDVSTSDCNFRLNFWSPADPNLYDVTFRIYKDGKEADKLESYFGMRDVESKGNQIYLNNQLFYQKLILDQGYFPSGGLTASVEELVKDVELIKAMGFNGARKHQKIEDPRYMYLCDVLGLVMWAELPSFFEYASAANENVIGEVHAFVRKHRNHPSVICYTVMNESWGINEVYRDVREQNFISALYYLVKSLDSTRLVVGNDGWEHGITDILTIHDYNSDPKSLKDSYANLTEALNGAPSKTSSRHCYHKGLSYNGAPFMISEYGGVAYETRALEGLDSWGYGERLNSQSDVLARIQALTQAVMEVEGCCGFCYTQLSDVEQEVNGLLDHDHNPKFDVETIREIFENGHNSGFLFI